MSSLEKGQPVSDNTPDATVPDPAAQPGPGYPPPAPPAYGAPTASGAAQTPPAYGAPQAPYGAAPQYGAAPRYGAAPQYGAPAYGYGAPAKTNVLAIVSLIASIVGFIGILPFIGSLGGIITGHISLNQLKTNGENGRGMALAGTIVGYVGLALWILGTILFFAFFAWAMNQGTVYSS